MPTPTSHSRSHRPGSPADAELEEQLSKRLVATLEPVVGAQRIRASVNVDYDTSSSEENQETYDPKSAVAVTMQTSEEKTSGGETTGGVPGTASNVPSANTPAKSDEDVDDTVQSSKTQNATYAVDKTVRHILQPMGRIRRISAALLVDDAIDTQQANGKTTETRRKRTPEELKQIEVLASAAIGLDEKRGDTLAVQNLSFQQSPAAGASCAEQGGQDSRCRERLVIGHSIRPHLWIVPVGVRPVVAPDQETGTLCIQSVARQVCGAVKSGNGRESGTRLPRGRAPV